MLRNLNLTDVWTCYKAFKRDILQGITLKENRFGLEPEVTAKIGSTAESMKFLFHISDLNLSN